MTGIESSSTISWKLREYRKSPTSTLGALPHSALAVRRPRRRSDSSTTSSCSRVEVWMNSMIAASWCARGPPPPRARAASTTSMGRRRLPPAATMCSEIWLISTTSEASRPRIRASTAAISPAARAWTWVMPGRETGRGWADMARLYDSRPPFRVVSHPRQGQWPVARAAKAGIIGPSTDQQTLKAVRHGARCKQGHPGRQPRQRPRDEVHAGRHGHLHPVRGHQLGAQGQGRQPAGTHRVAPREAVRQARRDRRRIPQEGPPGVYRGRDPLRQVHRPGRRREIFHRHHRQRDADAWRRR